MTIIDTKAGRASKKCHLLTQLRAYSSPELGTFGIF